MSAPAASLEKGNGLHHVGGFVPDQRHVPPTEVVVELELLMHEVLRVLGNWRAQRILKPQRHRFQPHLVPSHIEHSISALMTGTASHESTDPVAGSGVVAEGKEEHAAGALGAGHVAIPPRHCEALAFGIWEVHNRPGITLTSTQQNAPAPTPTPKSIPSIALSSLCRSSAFVESKLVGSSTGCSGYG
eukprot:465906-Rhodomonas_salina.3